MEKKLQLAVNHALNDAGIARARMAMLNPSMGLDAKRNSAWSEYGFPAQVTYDMLFNLYRRGGIAHGAVGKITGACWRTDPEIIEGDEQDKSLKETSWERKSKGVLSPRLWRAFADADRRRLVGRYAGLLLHIKDGKAWGQPASGTRGLAKVTAAWAGALKAVDIEADVRSPGYGMPKSWQYTEVSGNGRLGRQIEIHPDRVFILGDWAEDAIGWLEPAYNAFVSLEKVEGGSGEAFLKNAGRQIAVNFDKDIDFQNLASMYGVNVTELQEKFNEAAREINRGNDQMLVLQGAQATPLVANVADPQPTYNVNLQTAAAALDIPTKILVGMQTGERASSEDQKYFNSRCQARRMDLSFEIEDLVDHLARIGVLDAPARKAVIWDDLTEATHADKLASAKLMSDINGVALSNGQAIFDDDEIRVAAGYDPRDDEVPLPEGGQDGSQDEASDSAP